MAFCKAVFFVYCPAHLSNNGLWIFLDAHSDRYFAGKFLQYILKIRFVSVCKNSNLKLSKQINRRK